MLPIVSPSIILWPLPKPINVLQANVAVPAGQDELYKAKPRLPVVPLVVSSTLLNLKITEDEAAVKEYQISSLFSVLVQEGLGVDAVAPVVFAATAAVQLMPKGCVAMGIALAHSSLAGGEGTSCTQKLKLI